MRAAEVLAQHRKLWTDACASCSGCEWRGFGTITRTDLSHAAHQIDALKAAGYAVVETQCIESDDLVDKIAKAVGWCDNPDPDDPQDALDTVVSLLWEWVRSDSAGARSAEVSS